MKRFQVSPIIARRARSIHIGASAGNQHILLGRLSEVGPQKTVHYDVEQEHVIAIVGKRGSGKTHTLGVVVEGLGIADSTGTLGTDSNDHAVIVFDTLNLFQWIGIPLESAAGPAAKQLAMASTWGLPSVSIQPSLWHLAGLTPTSSNSEAFFIRVADMLPQDWGLLMDVDIVGDPMGQLISAAYDKVTRSGWSSGEKRIAPIPNHSIEDLIKCISEDTELAGEFVQDTRRAVRQRLASYNRIGMFSTEGTPLQRLLKPGHVSVLLLGRIPEDLRTLVLFLLIRRLLDQRAAASEASKDALIRGESRNKSLEVPKTWVVIDEAQNIIPARTASLANRELARFVREGRNFGLSMVLSTQQPVAIDEKVMAQVDTLIAHTLTVKQDINYITSNIKAAIPDNIKSGNRTLKMSDVLRELEVGQCLISAVESHRAMFVEVRPRVTPHGGFEQ